MRINTHCFRGAGQGERAKVAGALVVRPFPPNIIAPSIPSYECFNRWEMNWMSLKSVPAWSQPQAGIGATVDWAVLGGPDGEPGVVEGGDGVLEAARGPATG